MERKFWTTKEVANLLRVTPKTLQNYSAQHDIYRPSRPGIWYSEHVRILERVWAGIISKDEGLTLWSLEKEHWRERLPVME